MCVLVNNIENVRRRLDELFRSMDVDEVAQIMSENAPEKPPKPNESYEFDITFVQAERLCPLDSNELSDPYVLLYSKENVELWRGPTVYADISPRWNASYTVTLSEETMYLVCINDQDKVHKDRLCGWVYLYINPLDY